MAAKKVVKGKVNGSKKEKVNTKRKEKALKGMEKWLSARKEQKAKKNGAVKSTALNETEMVAKNA